MPICPGHRGHRNQIRRLHNRSQITSGPPNCSIDLGAQQRLPFRAPRSQVWEAGMPCYYLEKNNWRRVDGTTAG
jgi:hypothetical protein